MDGQTGQDVGRKEEKMRCRRRKMGEHAPGPHPAPTGTFCLPLCARHGRCSCFLTQSVGTPGLMAAPKGALWEKATLTLLP